MDFSDSDSDSGAEFPTSIERFWGTRVLPEQEPLKISLHATELLVTQACLGPPVDPSDTEGHATLYVSSGIGKDLAVCVLRRSGPASVALNLSFYDVDESVSFTVKGTESIHLTGQAALDTLAMQSDFEDSSDEEGEGEEAEDEVEEEDVAPAPKGKAKAKAKAKAAATPKEKATPAKADKKGKAAAAPAAAAPAPAAAPTPAKEEGKKKSKAERKKEAAAKKAAAEAATAAAVAEKSRKEKEEKANKKRRRTDADEEKKELSEVALRKPKTVKLPNGLVMTDTVVGLGKKPVSGRKVSVHYVGRLTNGKVFDRSQGQPFTFRIGLGNVIKGWDIGVSTMRVGGKRTLTCPAALAYGRKGVPGTIPPNATLVFDVEMVRC